MHVRALGAGEQDAEDTGAGLLEATDHLQAVHSREIFIDQDHIDGPLGDERQGAIARAGADDSVAFHGQHPRELPLQIGIGFHEEHATRALVHRIPMRRPPDARAWRL